MCHRYSGGLCVCELKHKHRRKNVIYHWCAFLVLILQRLCANEVGFNERWSGRSHTCKRVSWFAVPKCHFVLKKVLCISQRYCNFLSDQISWKHSSFDFESLQSNVNFKCLFARDILGTTVFCWLIIWPKINLKCSAAILCFWSVYRLRASTHLNETFINSFPI